MSAGRPRHDLLIALANHSPRPIVDVGADHGRVARGAGGVATEKEPHRVHGPGTWVVGDGLQPFGRLGTAVIAGMGARTILHILRQHPVERAILHAQDDPERLRIGLAPHWNIVDESLAPEAGRYAQIVVVEPGRTQVNALHLRFGPRLIEGSHPLRSAHFAQLTTHLERLVQQTRGSEAEAEMRSRLRFVRAIL